MSKISLVTGGTGLIGFNIINALLKRNRKVRVLVRSIKKAKQILPSPVELFQGDILDKNLIQKAMKDCDVVYHAAGFPEQWMKDKSVFDAVNYKGTKNMVEVAANLKIEKFIYTSTIDVFKTQKGQLYNESIIDERPKGTVYERSKQKAFRWLANEIEKGFPAINIHPAGLYGPGPTDSPGINQFIIDLKNGKMPLLLPGGLPLAYSEDVGEGHVLAEEKGKIGESYILSDNYYSLPDLALEILKTLKLGKKPPRVMPLYFVKLISSMGEKFSVISGKPPLIPKGQLHFLLCGAIPDATKAKKEMGWKATSLTKGLKQTIEFLLMN